MIGFHQADNWKMYRYKQTHLRGMTLFDLCRVRLSKTDTNNYTYNSNVKVDKCVIYTKLYKNVIMKNGRKPAWSLYESAGT